jgi:hypothetical protein
VVTVTGMLLSLALAGSGKPNPATTELGLMKSSRSSTPVARNTAGPPLLPSFRTVSVV